MLENILIHAWYIIKLLINICGMKNFSKIPVSKCQVWPLKDLRQEGKLYE